MRFEFLIVDGPGTGRRFQLDANGTQTVGRTSHADQTISSDLIMSSVHFKLESDGHACRLQDLNSTNGSFVNGQAVKQKVLQDGDMITAGNTTFEFRIVPSVDTDRSPSVPPASAPSDPGTVIIRETTSPTSEGQEPLREEDMGLVHVNMEGPFGVRCITLAPGRPYVFGRTQRADIVVPDEMISASHFSLRCENATVSLQDLGSSNGTYQNEQRVQRAALHAGDSFTAGTTRFQITKVPDVPARQTSDMPTEHALPTHNEGVDDEAAPEPDVSHVTAITSDRDEQTGTADDEPQAPSAHTPPQAVEVAAMSAENLEAPVFRTTDTIRSKWPYRQGICDMDIEVRTAALLSAVWTAQPWIMEQCRTATDPPTLLQLPELFLRAILGDDTDFTCFQALVGATQLGTVRFRVLGVYGHPRLVPELIEAMDMADMSACRAAWEAYQRVSGASMPSKLAASTPVSAGIGKADEALPDRDFARKQWQKLAPALQGATRVSRGIVLAPASGELAEDTLDMATKLEIELRQIAAGERRATAQCLFRTHDYFRSLLTASEDSEARVDSTST